MRWHASLACPDCGARRYRWFWTRWGARRSAQTYLDLGYTDLRIER